MATLKHKNSHHGPGDMNDSSFLPQANGDRKKLSWFQLHASPENALDGHISFRQHVERMTAFWKSHFIFQHAGTTSLMDEPVINVDDDMIENGGSRNLLQEQNWLLGLTVNKSSTHDFSPN
jgi:hypothetical protein